MIKLEKILTTNDWVQVSSGVSVDTVQVKEGLVTITISPTAPVGRIRDFQIGKSNNGGWLTITPPDIAWATATHGEAVIAVTYTG